MLKVVGIAFGIGLAGYLASMFFPSFANLSPWFLLPVAIVVLMGMKVREGYLAAGSAPSEPRCLCTHCQSKVNPEIKTPGNFGLEVFCWLCFLVPGLLYSIWRRTARTSVCPVCHAPNPIPLETPAAQQIVART